MKLIRETAPSHPERRDAERIPSALPLYVNGDEAKLIDLSTTGVGFVTECPPRLGATVDIAVRHLPDDAHPQPQKIEVVHISEQEGGIFSVGAKLVKEDSGG